MNNIKLILICILSAEAAICFICAKQAYDYKQYGWTKLFIFCTFAASVAIYKLGDW